MPDASKVTGVYVVTGKGVMMNAGIGAPLGGRITPRGTTRISTNRELNPLKSVPMGVSTSVTTVNVSTGSLGAGGAV